MANKETNYDSELLCEDLAKSDLSIADIALKHQISARQVYAIAKGDSRPDLLVRINKLIAAEKSAGMRLAKSRARFAVARLVQIAKQDEDRGAALRAIESLLEMGGMLEVGGGDDKKTIEIVFSAKKGEADPLAHRLTGVVNGNN